LTSFIGIPI
jgi:hypothetical protein